MGAPDTALRKELTEADIHFSDCGIYKITNLKNDKFYIGSSSSCSRRQSEHKSRLRRNVHINKKLQSAWNKYGEGNFLFEVVFIIFNEIDILEIEQSFLNDYLAVENGYNLSPTAGRTTGWKASLETRAKMSAAAKKRDNSLQVIAMKKATTGKKRPKYVIEAMQKGRRDNPLSDESREKMAKSAVARSKYSQADRKKMVEMHREGVSYRAIAKHFGLAGHYPVIAYTRRWIKENEQTS